MQVTLFDSLYDNQPKRKPTTFEGLAVGLKKRTITDSKSDVKLWNATVYNGTRANENVVEVQAGIFDFDKGATPEEFENQLNGYSYVLYSTYSHTPESPKFRIVLKFTEPVAVKDWPEIWTRLNYWLFSNKSDPACKDAARIYYLPSNPEGSEVLYKHGKGSPFNPRTLDPIPIEHDRGIEKIAGGSAPLSGADKYARAAFEKEVSGLSLVGEGGRNAALNQAAYNLGQLVGAGRLARDQVESALFTVAIGLPGSTRLSEREIRSTIRSGLQAGASSPRLQTEPASRTNAVVAAVETKTQKSLSRFEGFTDSQLFTMKFPHVPDIVEGIIQRGVTIFCGGSKLGKSVLMTNLGVEVSQGGTIFGEIVCQEGRVLYLALEDSTERVAGRMCKALGYREPTGKLHIYNRWPKAHEGGIEAIELFIEKYPDTKLIIIDTLVRFKPPSVMGANVYEQDYRTIEPLQELGKRKNIGIVIVHHTKKGTGQGEDIFEMISGSNGLFASADACWIMKRERDTDQATLYVTGRDTEYKELSLRLNPEYLVWILEGDAYEVRNAGIRQAVISTLQSSRQAMNSHLLLQEVREEGYDINGQQLRMTLGKMKDEGIIRLNNFGRYELIKYELDEEASSAYEAQEAQRAAELLGGTLQGLYKQQNLMYPMGHEDKE